MISLCNHFRHIESLTCLSTWSFRSMLTVSVFLFVDLNAQSLISYLALLTFYKCTDMALNWRVWTNFQPFCWNTSTQPGHWVQCHPKPLTTEHDDTFLYWKWKNSKKTRKNFGKLNTHKKRKIMPSQLNMSKARTTKNNLYLLFILTEVFFLINHWVSHFFQLVS